MQLRVLKVKTLLNDAFKISTPFVPQGSDIQVAQDAGAFITGGEEVVKGILDHSIHHRSFDYCVATPDMMPVLSKLKVKLRKRFPNTKRGKGPFWIQAIANRSGGVGGGGGLSPCEYLCTCVPPPPKKKTHQMGVFFRHTA